MINFRKIYSLLSLPLLLASCAVDGSEGSAPSGSAIFFGVEGIAQTKVDYGDQSNGGISADFVEGDKIGLYAFYNNFYLYYPEYLNYAESVIFVNEEMTIDAANNATYAPLRSWTFSTLYGTFPYTLDCMAYYPFAGGENPRYANMTYSSKGAATLEYYYVGYLGTESTDEVVNIGVDFMTAHKSYNKSGALTEDQFREEMLNLSYVPLNFTRRLASLNLKVTKPEGYATDIIVTGLTIYFDAYSKFSLDVNSGNIVWSETDGTVSQRALTASVGCNMSLEQTVWDLATGTTNIGDVDNLLDDMLFFPPSTDIKRIDFTLTDSGVSKTYTWHPHVATIEQNRHYTLKLELDPNRAN